MTFLLFRAIVTVSPIMLQEAAMKLVTFNIRYDCGTDGINNFSCRKPYILEAIAREEAE